MHINEILPATHTEKEWGFVPHGYIHLVKDGRVIHKKPAAFEPRKGVKVEYKERFDKDTGRQWVEEIREEVKRPPAASLKEYKKDGWERCNRDGSEILNMDGTPREKPGPKIKGDS